MRKITVYQTGASKLLRILAALLCGSAMSACSLLKPVGPDYVPPETNLPASYRFETTKNGKPAAQREQWWTVFQDSGLNSLMEKVRSSNQQLKAAFARVKQSRATIRTAKADKLFNLSTSPSASREETSDNVRFGGFVTNSYSLPLDATWELDLFGRVRRNIESAQADAEATEEMLRDLQLSLETEAASRYFTIRATDREIDIVKEEVKSREDSLRLAQDRFDLGAVSQLDVTRARSELASNQANLADLTRQRIANEAAIALIAGVPASSFSLPHSPLVGNPPKIPASIPSELLRARPDIRAAERQVAAANARIGVATAAFYPSISLTGSVGLESTSIDKFLTRGAQFWSIGPEIKLPIFTGGKIRANLNFTKAQYEEILANYQQTVLRAISEVETRLASTRQLVAQDEALAAAVEAARESRTTAKDQYTGGLTDYLSLLDSERTTLTTERSQAMLVGSEYVNTVNLIKALGGRW